MTGDSQSEPPNFDPLARLYCWMEYLSFGPMLSRCRFYFLPHITNANRALVFGDGDGRFIARLLAENPMVHVDAVDCSSAMLAESRRRSSDSIRLRTIHADIRSFTPDHSHYDVIVSHFFLDCLTESEIANLVERIIPHLAADARWLVSEFAIPRTGWQRLIGRGIVGLLYFAFDKMTHLTQHQLPDYAAVLRRQGFVRQQSNYFLQGLLVAEVWARHSKHDSSG